ncbi:MAG: PIG-L deacetylase family protein [Ilumatobacteraceae bacterium]
MSNEPGQPPVDHDVEFRSVDLPTPTVALAIGAHPDDIEFGCGGTLAKWAKDGCLVHNLILTDGSKGTWNPDADIETLKRVRRDEQREAARRLGGQGEVLFLNQVDGELEESPALRDQIVAAIRRLRPQVVLGHDPWKRYRLHPDHRRAGFLTCDAIVVARDPHFSKHLGLDHHRPEHLLLWEADAPDHGEDITTTVDTKIQALLAHESQFESTMKAVEPSELERFAERMRLRIADNGRRIGRPAAEVFKKMSDI